MKGMGVLMFCSRTENKKEQKVGEYKPGEEDGGEGGSRARQGLQRTSRAQAEDSNAITPLTVINDRLRDRLRAAQLVSCTALIQSQTLIASPDPLPKG
ncbi:hypothetical protein NDU88_004919 [Pleurodeles waltl]|uniref:Uncharacterized protein n=1 Tax=Pleurodeles waltl TaxID=8319 RepID=A0AAV7MWT9_PLEWA|nr:hypothetical protein NDU88_004919 [Pleurodeles waltl]